MTNFITLSNRIINTKLIAGLNSILPNNLSKRITPCQGKIISKLLGLDNLIKNILIFNIGSESEGPIHIDIDKMDTVNMPSKFALNIPIINCNDLIVNWYISNKSILEVPDNKIPDFPNTPMLEKKYATEIEKTDCLLPHIVNIDTWHSVINKSTFNTAKLISIRFFEDRITKDELVKRFL
jgi:hypothetical protein